MYEEIISLLIHLSRMKTLLSYLVACLAILLILQLFFRVREGFLYGDDRPQRAPCYSDADCGSLRCSEGMCR